LKSPKAARRGLPTISAIRPSGVSTGPERTTRTLCLPDARSNDSPRLAGHWPHGLSAESRSCSPRALLDLRRFRAVRIFNGSVRLSVDSDRRIPWISTCTNGYPAAGITSDSILSPPKKMMSSCGIPRATRTSATASAGYTCPPDPAAAIPTLTTRCQMEVRRRY
jgi:hypothetical protein